MDTTLSQRLLKFYDNSARVLPWRDNKNPYYIWVSEIMLQQTRVEAVIPYFERFIKEVPTIEALSNIDDDRLMKLWEGLGYYSRARNLKKAAIQVMNDFKGSLPSNKKDLESLSGIGPYTSGAILSIAYEQKVAAVDGNVLRVFSRVYKIQDDIKDKATKRMIKTLVEESLPKQRNGDYNQAIMELGATVCIPNGRPLCEQCPLEDMCEAQKSNMQMMLPFKSKKTIRKIEERTVFLLKYNNLYAIRKRPSEGLLASLYEYPNFDGHVNQSNIEIEYTSFTKLPSSKHVFTHKEWIMKGYLLETVEKSEEYIWVSKEEIENDYSIPRAFRAYTNLILKD
jgi:A/G-specific adenine glycosylase